MSLLVALSRRLGSVELPPVVFTRSFHKNIISWKISTVKPVFNDIKHGILFTNWQDGACWSLGLYTKNETRTHFLWLESQSFHSTLAACVSQIALRKQYSRGFVNQNNFSGESRDKTASSRWNFSSRVFQATFGMKSEFMHLHGIPTLNS